VEYPDIILAIKAGELKCRFRNKLSYVNSFAIALALVYGYEMHPTEKNLPPIHKQKVITYDFQKG